MFPRVTEGFLSLVYIGTKGSTQPLCLDSYGPWTPKRPPLVLLYQKAVVRGLIQATLVGIPFKPFGGSLFEVDVGGLTSTTFCILEVHVGSKVSLNRTLVKAVQGAAECHSHSHTCSGCQMTVEKDVKEGDWSLSKGHQHFGFSITSTRIPDGITWCGKVVMPAAPLPF